MARHYFDWAATAVPGPGEFAHTLNGAVPFGNPSSVHAEGKAARAALEAARSRCAKTLGVKAEELYFTSGGTEANAIVLFSLLCKPGIFRRENENEQSPAGPLVNKSAVLLYSAAEHPSIRENASALEQLGVPCASIGVGADGRVSEITLEKALAKNPAARMAAVMAVNNETGAINDMKALAAVINKSGDKAPIHLHCDAVQAAGKIPLDFHGWGIDSASLSAHKLGGSRGTGLLWLKSPLAPLFRGGGQERKIRPGTENTAGAMKLAEEMERHVVPLGKNAELPPVYTEAAERMKTLLLKLQSTGFFIPIPKDRGEEDSRFSPWILQGAFRNRSGKTIPGEVLARALDEKGFAVSTGSACSSRSVKRPVLEAMGLDEETSRGGIRISQGWSTTMEEIHSLAGAITALLNTL